MQDIKKVDIDSRHLKDGIVYVVYGEECTWAASSATRL